MPGHSPGFKYEGDYSGAGWLYRIYPYTESIDRCNVTELSPGIYYTDSGRWGGSFWEMQYAPSVIHD